MFDYYIVLGGWLDPYRHLQHAVSMIQSICDVVHCSRYYVGPSEAPDIPHSFMNVALHVASLKCIEEMRVTLTNIEARQLYQGRKVIDIDLILQLQGGQCRYQSSKINYGHVLITLKDVLVSAPALRSTILEKCNRNPNAYAFLPIHIESL